MIIKIKMQEQFEEECNNAVKAIFDARASNDYGCRSIKYLLYLIDIAINEYKNLELTVKLCTAISKYMPEYKLRRYTINLCNNEYSEEDMDQEDQNEDQDQEDQKDQEDQAKYQELCSEKYNLEEKIIEKDLEKTYSIKNMNPFIKECEEAILFHYEEDRTYNDIFKRINYLINLIEKCIDNYEDPDTILRLSTFLTKYANIHFLKMYKDK